MIPRCSAQRSPAPCCHASGFGATIGLFLAVLAVNVVIALLMPSIRSLPAADHWDDASL